MIKELVVHANSKGVEIALLENKKLVEYHLDAYDKEGFGAGDIYLGRVKKLNPGGMGRSKMITVTDKGAMGEVKLENFFSMVGINFENIRMNDNMITNKIADLTNEGWTLKFVNTGVYGADKSTGIYITRYIFSRQK